MRAVVIPALLLLALAGLAVIPDAAAAPQPIYPCEKLSGMESDSSAFDIDVTPRCQVAVSVDVVDCLWGETWVNHTVGPATVRYTTCQSQPPDATASAFAPGPSACGLQSATPTSLGPTSVNPQRFVWGYDLAQCDIDVEPIGACAPPSGKTLERRVAFVHLTLLLCDGGIDPPAWS